MRDDPVMYTFASIGNLGFGMILSNYTILLIIFLAISLTLSILGIRKSGNNRITKIVCLLLAIITVIYLISSIILLITWNPIRRQIQNQWS